VPIRGRAGNLLQREADVADGGAQLRGGCAGRDAAGDDEPGDGVQVDVAGVAAGQGDALAAAGGRFPGEGLADAEAGQEGGGVLVQFGAQRRGERVGEAEVAGLVLAVGEGERAAGSVKSAPVSSS
jgi:hypothetical protein